MNKLFLSFGLLICSLSINNLSAQIKKGRTLYGLTNYFEAMQISMSDANHLLVSDRDSGNIIVSAINWNGSDWQTMGDLIQFDTVYKSWNYAIDMGDSNTIAIGLCQDWEVFSNKKGLVKVYQWNGIKFDQKGADIVGIDQHKGLVGWDIAMPDSKTVGFSSLDGVQVFHWISNQWVKKGNTIQEYDSNFLLLDFGRQINMPDANHIAIYALHSDSFNNYEERVSIYQWSGNQWKIMGEPISTGFKLERFFGSAFDMPTSSVIAFSDCSDSIGGSVTVYVWDGAKWIQKGQKLYGVDSFSVFGGSVSMPNNNVIAVGAPMEKTASGPTGAMYIYTFKDNVWVENLKYSGYMNYEQFGANVIMPNYKTILVSMPGYYDQWSTGRIYIYEDLNIPESLGVNKISKEFSKIFPNPSQSNLYMRTNMASFSYSIMNSSGQIICSGESRGQIDIESLPKGIYVLKTMEGNFKFIKEY